MKIEALLTYRHDKSIQRYNDSFPNFKYDGEIAFRELMKYIYLCFKHADERKRNPHDATLNFVCVVHKEMHFIDEMWHIFLLFTRDYLSFCANYLNGHYFHHDPIENTEEISDQVYEQNLERYLHYIAHLFGDKTLALWFDM
jgi:hypothetical protein